MKGILVVLGIVALVYGGYTFYETGAKNKQEQMQKQDQVVDETSNRVRDQLKGIQKDKKQQEDEFEEE